VESAALFAHLMRCAPTAGADARINRPRAGRVVAHRALSAAMTLALSHARRITFSAETRASI